MGSVATAPFEVLLVEDNPGDIRLTREAFRETGAAVNLRVVTDGVLAIDFLKNRGMYVDAPRPDIILLDLNLPRKSGREFLADVKRDDQLRGIPTVVLTTSQAELDIVEAYQLGANSYVPKPVDLAGFFRVVIAIQQYWFGTARLCRR